MNLFLRFSYTYDITYIIYTSLMQHNLCVSNQFLCVLWHFVYWSAIFHIRCGQPIISPWLIHRLHWDFPWILFSPEFKEFCIYIYVYFLTFPERKIFNFISINEYFNVKFLNDMSILLDCSLPLTHNIMTWVVTFVKALKMCTFCINISLCDHFKSVSQYWAAVS